MGTRRKINYLGIAALSLYIAIAAAVLYFSPEQIIEWVGPENGYVLIFTFALVSGLSLFAGVPHQLILITLSAGGLNPLAVSAAATIGVMLGESTSYFLGYHGRVLSPESGLRIQRWMTLLEKRHPRLLPLAFFGIGSLPISNDMVTIPMGLAHYPFWKVMLPLAVGNLLYNTLIAFFGIYAYAFLQQIF